MIQPIIQRFFFVIIITSLAISLLVRELYGNYESFYSYTSGAFIYVFLSILGLNINKSSEKQILYSDSIIVYHEILGFLLYFMYLITYAFFFGILLYEMLKIYKSNKRKDK